MLGELVEAARNSTVAAHTEEPPLSVFKDEAMGVYTVGLKTPASRGPALEGLKSMVKTSGLLTDEELGFIVHNVNEILQDNEHTDDETR